MSVQTLYTAATGMQALETKLDVIANNMANINTTAFKKDRANFEDLFYRQHKLPGATDADGNVTSTGIDVGLGVRVSSMQSDFDQGAFEQTGNQLDIAIEGDGFLAVQGPGGETLYTRAGNLGRNATGELVVGSANNGYRLIDGITIPDEAVTVNISNDGTVEYSQSGQDGYTTAGQLTLSTFINPDGLIKLGDNLYKPSPASGNASQGTPGQAGIGTIRQNALEASNVEPVTELIDLINTQRAFELNSQVVQAGDQVMQIVANLRRG